MTGRDEMELKIENKINMILKKSPNLRGFFNSLSMEMSSKYEYIRHVYNFLQYVKKNISEIVYDDYIEYLAKIKTSENGEKTTSSYQINIYSALKKFSRYCYVSDKSKRDYMRDVDRPKAIQSQKTIEKRENGFLDNEQIKKYIFNVETSNIVGKKRKIGAEWRLRDYCIIQIFLNTGLRCSALVNLNIQDYNSDEKTLLVTEKGNKFRKFILSDGMCNVINDWLEIREKRVKDDCNALFISNQRTRITNSSVTRIVQKYAKTIQGKNISPHKLRASFATGFYKETKDIRALQELLGHTSIKTTQIYTRDNKNAFTEAADIMAKITNVQ